MEAGDSNLARVHCFEDAGQQADACAMAKFRILEAQVTDLP
jgi:hypothetical protein